MESIWKIFCKIVIGILRCPTAVVVRCKVCPDPVCISSMPARWYVNILTGTEPKQTSAAVLFEILPGNGDLRFEIESIVEKFVILRRLARHHQGTPQEISRRGWQGERFTRPESHLFSPWLRCLNRRRCQTASKPVCNNVHTFACCCFRFPERRKNPRKIGLVERDAEYCTSITKYYSAT